MAKTIEEIEADLFELRSKIVDVIEFQKTANWPANKTLADDAKAELQGKLDKLQERYDELHAEFVKLRDVKLDDAAKAELVKHACFWCE